MHKTYSFEMMFRIKYLMKKMSDQSFIVFKINIRDNVYQSNVTQLLVN
jgi:hypothetical protein